MNNWQRSILFDNIRNLSRKACNAADHAARLGDDETAAVLCGIADQVEAVAKKFSAADGDYPAQDESK